MFPVRASNISACITYREHERYAVQTVIERRRTHYVIHMELILFAQDMAKYLCRSLSRGLPSDYQSLQSQCSVYCKLHPKLSRFGFSKFRFWCSVNDVFVRMATGSGKSLSMFLLPLVHGKKLLLSLSVLWLG